MVKDYAFQHSINHENKQQNNDKKRKGKVLIL